MIKSLFKLFALIVFSSVTSFGQSGYLGSLDAVGFSINGTPSRFRKIKMVVDSDGDTARIAPLRYISPSFSISYSRVITRKIELGVNYTYTPIRSFTHKSRFIMDEFGSSIYTSLMEDVKGIQHALSFDVRFYRKGSIAPIGKYLGFSIMGGAMSTKEELTLVDLGSTSGSTFFKRKNKITYIYDEEEITNTSGNFFTIRGIIGRNYPISDKLMLNFSLSFPLISNYKNERESKTGFHYVTDGSDFPEIKKSDFRDVISFTMHKYNRAQLSFGIRFQL